MDTKERKVQIGKESIRLATEKLYNDIDQETLKSFYANLEKSHKSRDEAIDILKKYFNKEKLVFVLGAGVSVPYNVPDWNVLLQELLLNTFKKDSELDEDTSKVLAELYTEILLNNPLIAARGVSKSYKTEKNNMLLEEKVRDAFYKDIESVKDSETIKELVQFCIAPGKSPNINSIITYNYDDILENALNNSGIDVPYKSIYKVGMNISNGELPIYHVHGFLPRDGELTSDNLITLSEDSYHSQYNDIYSWNNIVQINKFRENCCLFIGASFRDPNLRRLLDLAMEQRGVSEKVHYLIRIKHNANEVTKKLEMLLDEDKFLSKKNKLASLETSQVVKYLIKIMEVLEEKDAESFGVQVIWIDSFDEIPEILKSIRI